MNKLRWIYKGIRLKLRLIRDFTINRIYISKKNEKNLIEEFHNLYYHGRNFNKGLIKTTWMGVETHKLPLDAWIYQEILFEIKPDVIIETGTYKGGSALYFASICDSIGKGKILTIEDGTNVIPKSHNMPIHKRIKYFRGSSISKEIINKIKKEIKKEDIILVVLDSNHRREHVLKELEVYNKFVTKGSYIIIEDTNTDGNPVKTYFGDGAMKGVFDFLEKNKDFEIDKSKEKFLLTFNPNGYLRRK